MLWTDKYAPDSLDAVAGNETARQEMRKWALEADAGKKVKPMLVHGPVGTGKTASVVALAREMKWNLLETNASDLRDEATLKRLYGLSMKSNSLYGERQLILIDEIDSVSDRKEYSTVKELVKESSQPVVLIANDVWNQKLADFRFSCKLVEFKKVNASTILKALEAIAAKEGFEARFAEEIASGSSGDLRAAITDMQALGSSAERFESYREREENVFNAVKNVFKAASYKDAVEAGENLSVDFDLFQRWIEENIPAEYEKANEQAQAFAWLSRADVFKGRIMKRQHWGFLKYVRALTLAGVASSRDAVYRKFTKYAFPGIMRKYSQTRERRGLVKSALKKARTELHLGSSEAREALVMLSSCEGLGTYLQLSHEEGSLLPELYKNEKKKHGKAKD